MWPIQSNRSLASITQHLREYSGNRFRLRPLKGPSPTSFDQAFAEILRERSPISTNIKPSQPSFDHQALAEMLSELRADPINPQTSPLSFDTESSSAPFSGQIDHEEPVAKAFTVAPSTNAESARPPRAKSLLAKLHHIFSTKEEPLLSNVEKDPLSAVSDVAVTSPTSAASAWPRAGNVVAEPKLIFAELSPPTFESKSSSPPVAESARQSRTRTLKPLRLPLQLKRKMRGRSRHDHCWSNPFSRVQTI